MGFSALVALFVAALAVGVGHLMRDGIRDAALSGAEQTGRVFAELEVGEEEYSSGRLTDTSREGIDTAVKTSSTLLTARMWGRDGRLLYEGGERPTGGRQNADRALRTAFGGEVESLASDKGSERLLKIFVPISLPGDERPRNVLELYLPYAPVQAGIDTRTKNMALLTVLAALLFYAVLLPSVLRGSGALADSYEARQLPLQRRLRRAMRDGELALAYQPKLDLVTGSIGGVEALVRWHLPDGSTVPPGDYIPLVETTPVMSALTGHVFDMAATQSAAWSRQGIDLDVAVNVSACDLRDDALPLRLARAAEAHGLSPSNFTLELTESAVSQSPDADLRTLAALREQGFKLSIDDFGTGESSLSRINLVEFQEVKIDQSFVRCLGEGSDAVVVTGIIDLAQALGARVVAEGVESEATASRLADLGCDVAQGFHFARPLPAHELTEWLSGEHSKVGEASRAPVQ